MKENNKDFILPFMLADHSANGRILSIDNSIKQIISLHNYPNPISILLSELLIIACFLGQNLKGIAIPDPRLNSAIGFQDELAEPTKVGEHKRDPQNSSDYLQMRSGITCQIQQGEGAVSLMVAEYSFGGNIRGYAGFNEAEVTNSSSFLDLVKGSKLVVTVESGNEKYQGIINLDQKNLATAFEQYLEKSEQIEATLLISANISSVFDEKNISAKGIILKKMPNSNENAEDDWLRYKHFIHSLSEDELNKLEPSEILTRLFHGDGVLLFDESEVFFKCRCSKIKMQDILKTIPIEEKEHLKVDGKISIKCQFCSHEESFDA